MAACGSLVGPRPAAPPAALLVTGNRSAAVATGAASAAESAIMGPLVGARGCGCAGGAAAVATASAATAAPSSAAPPLAPPPNCNASASSTLSAASAAASVGAEDGGAGDACGTLRLRSISVSSTAPAISGAYSGTVAPLNCAGAAGSPGGAEADCGLMPSIPTMASCITNVTA